MVMPTKITNEILILTNQSIILTALASLSDIDKRISDILVAQAKTTVDYIESTINEHLEKSTTIKNN